MVDFDRMCLRILRYIRRKNGATEGALRDKFGDEANSFFLIDLTREMYLLAQDNKGNFVTFQDGNFSTAFDFTYFITPKTRELMEKRSFDFWKWVIPTLISTTALVISALALITTKL